jgi:hypothetical protein
MSRLDECFGDNMFIEKAPLRATLLACRIWNLARSAFVGTHLSCSVRLCSITNLSSVSNGWHKFQRTGQTAQRDSSDPDYSLRIVSIAGQPDPTSLFQDALLQRSTPCHPMIWLGRS